MYELNIIQFRNRTDDIAHGVILLAILLQPVMPRESMHWTTSDGQPPPDTPACGFSNELCPPEEEGQFYYIITNHSRSLSVALTCLYRC